MWKKLYESKLFFSVIVGVLFASLVGMCALTMVNVAKKIEQRGLKNIIAPIWNGTQVK
jgi:cytochrome bd-type quinol oxidase subunit 2